MYNIDTIKCFFEEISTHKKSAYRVNLGKLERLINEIINEYKNRLHSKETIYMDAEKTCLINNIKGEYKNKEEFVDNINKVFLKKFTNLLECLKIGHCLFNSIKIKDDGLIGIKMRCYSGFVSIGAFNKGRIKYKDKLNTLLNRGFDILYDKSMIPEGLVVVGLASSKKNDLLINEIFSEIGAKKISTDVCGGIINDVYFELNQKEFINLNLKDIFGNMTGNNYMNAYEFYGLKKLFEDIYYCYFMLKETLNPVYEYHLKTSFFKMGEIVNYKYKTIDISNVPNYSTKEFNTNIIF